jgi:hypothetical protein
MKGVLDEMGSRLHRLALLHIGYHAAIIHNIIICTYYIIGARGSVSGLDPPVQVQSADPLSELVDPGQQPTFRERRVPVRDALI